MQVLDIHTHYEGTARPSPFLSCGLKKIKSKKSSTQMKASFFVSSFSYQERLWSCFSSETRFMNDASWVMNSRVILGGQKWQRNVELCMSLFNGTFSFYIYMYESVGEI